MSSFRDIAKGGWNPKGKDGGKESWRDMRGINQVAGLMGKGKEDPNAPPSTFSKVRGMIPGQKSDSSTAREDPHDHRSAPLSTLKDPSSFGPPPRHIAVTGGVPAAPARTASSDGVGRSGTSSDEPASRYRQKEDQEADEPLPPPVPYRVDTTGLDTANLPKPPVRRANHNEELPSALAPKPRVSPAPTAGQRPIPPPRLPPRQSSRPDVSITAPPSAYTSTSEQDNNSYINKASSARLAQAGVSVPGFNITRTTSPPVSDSRPCKPPASTNQLSDLQGRFSRMTSPLPTPNASSPTSPQNTGSTTWAQKKSALQTFSDFQKDPKSVSMSGARDALTTANSFRQRHGEKATAGFTAAQRFSTGERIYGATAEAAEKDRVREERKIAMNHPERAGHELNWQAPPDVETRPQLGSVRSDSADVLEVGDGGAAFAYAGTGGNGNGNVVAKKAPPRPPKKKNLAMYAGTMQEDAPPPVPLGSKPR